MSAIPERRTARLIILDPADRMLLISYQGQKDIDPAKPGERAFWYTPGGGIEPGETAEQAALREMEEEVGLTGLPIIAEVARREALVDMFIRVAFCKERYFLVRAPHARIDTSRLAETDVDPILDVRWWDLQAFTASRSPLIPAAVLPLARRLAAGHLPAAPVDLT